MTRRFSSLAAVLVAVSIVLVACDNGPRPSTPPAGSAGPSAGSPSAGAPTGTLTVGLAAEPESLDPALVYQSAGQSVMFALYDTILTIAADGTLGKGVADTWTVVDPMTIELKLHPGLTFSDGTPVDAAAVRFTIDRIRDVDPATNQALPDARKLNSQWARDFTAVDTIEIPDASTVRIKLKRPDATIPNALGRTFVVPLAYNVEPGNAIFAKPIGSGPFTFKEYAKDNHVTVERNPKYWDSPRGQPLVASVVFRSIPDAATRLNELVTGGVQLIQDPPVDQLDRITSAGGRVPTIGDGRRYLIWISMDGKGALAQSPNKTADQKAALDALSKPTVREALNLAVDRQAIIDTLLDGKGEPMTNILVKPDLGFDPSIPPFRYDPDRARQLLKDAGYPNGFSVDLDVCTCDRSDLPEAVVGELAKVGVKATIKPFEVSTFNSDWSSGKTDPLRASRLSFSDPNVYLQLWLRSGGLLSRYGNPAVDALIDQQAAEYDATKRAAIIGQIAKQTRTDIPAIFLWSSPNLYGVAKTVPEWTPTLLGYLPVTGVAVTGG